MLMWVRPYIHVTPRDFRHRRRKGPVVQPFVQPWTSASATAHAIQHVDSHEVRNGIQSDPLRQDLLDFDKTWRH